MNTSGQVVESTKLIISALSSAFDVLAEKAGVSAGYFWPILVRQQILEGICVLFIGLIAIAISTGIIIFAVKANTSSSRITISNEVCLAIGLIGCFIWCIVFFVFAMNFSDCITHIFNPEYAAIQEVINMGSKLVK